MGVHSQQTEESEPVCELWLCQLAHRGVLTLSSWGLTWWASSNQQMAGLLMGSLQTQPSRAMCSQCRTACWELTWGSSVILSRGVSSASSSSDSAPCAANDIHKRLCQISSLFFLSNAFWGYRSQMLVSGCLGCCWAFEPILAGS